MTTRYRRGRIAVIGAGPAGMATALSVHQAGHDVLLLERYPQARPAGDPLFPFDPIYQSITSEGARARLIAAYDHDSSQHDFLVGYRWDIVLTGPHATLTEDGDA